MLQGRLLRGGAWLTAGNALSALASFLRNVAIARLISVEDFGIVALLSMMLAVFETISNLAIDRLLVQAPDGDEPKLQASAHALQVTRGVMGGVILFLMASGLSVLFKVPHTAWAFQALALVPVIRSLQHLDTVRYQREMRYGPTFWVVALPQGVSLALAVPLAYWLRDYSAIVWAIFAQTISEAVITHVLATRPYRWAWDRAQTLRILSFGWPLLANGLLMFAIFQGDKAIIAVAYTPAVVGWFSAAVMISMAPAMLVISVLNGLLLPVLSRDQQDPEKFRQRYLQVVQACLTVGLMTAVFFAVFGPELLILLFGERYAPGVAVVILLGMTQGVRIAKAGQFVAAIALASTKDPLVANLARGASLLVATLLVVMGYGPVAVAATGLAGEMLAYAIAVFRLSARLGVPLLGQMRPIAVWLLIAALSWSLGWELRDASPSLSLSHVLLGLAWLPVAAMAYVATSPAMFMALLQWAKGGKLHESA